MKSVSHVGLVAIAIMATGLIGGCNNPQDLTEQYQADQFQGNRDKLRAATGGYVGLLQSAQPEQKSAVWGVIELKLDTDSKVEPGDATNKASRSAVLVSDLSVTSMFNGTLVTAHVKGQDGFFDPSSGDFQVDFEVPAPDGGAKSSQIARMKGQFAPGGTQALSGTLTLTDSSDYGATFSLNSASDLTGAGADLLQKNPPIEMGLNQSYAGTLLLPGSISSQGTWIQTEPELDPASLLTKILSPTRPISVAVNFGDALQFSSESASIDLRASANSKSSLTGNARPVGHPELGSWVLNCQQTSSAPWSCSVSDTFHAEKLSLSVHAFDGTELEVLDPDLLNETDQFFKGQSQRTGTNGWAKSPAQMTVRRAQRSVTQGLVDLLSPPEDVVLQIELLYNGWTNQEDAGTGTGVGGDFVKSYFQQATLSQSNHTLQGTTVLTDMSTGESYSESLVCTGFTLEGNAAASPFKCSLKNSRLETAAEFQF